MKRVLLFMAIIPILMLLSGCWDRYELEERAMILAISIDVTDDREEVEKYEVTHSKGDFPVREDQKYYKLTAQLAVPGKIMLGPGGGETNSEDTDWLLVTYGYTMKDALSNLQQELAAKIYLGHIQIIVVSEEIAKNGISEIMDFLRRDYEVRRSAWLMITDGGEAQDILNATPPIQTVPSLYLSNTLKDAVRFGKLPKEFLGKIWIDFSDIGVDAMIPLVKSMGDHILVHGLAYFKGDKMVGKLTPTDTGAILAIQGMNPAGYSNVVETEDQSGVYLIKPQRRKSKISVKLVDGEPKVTINVKIEGFVEEQNHVNDLSKDRLEELEKTLSNYGEKALSKLMKRLQQDESDILGIGARVRAKYPKYWHEKVKDDKGWYEVYKDLDIQIHLDYKIRRVGMEWK